MIGKEKGWKEKDQKKTLITKNKSVVLDVTDLILYIKYKITKINSLTEVMELILAIIFK